MIYTLHMIRMYIIKPLRRSEPTQKRLSAQREAHNADKQIINKRYLLRIVCSQSSSTTEEQRGSGGEEAGARIRANAKQLHYFLEIQENKLLLKQVIKSF